MTSWLYCEHLTWNDERIWVVEVKTKNSTLTRLITKLVLLEEEI